VENLQNMSREELKAFIKCHGLPITVKKSWADDQVRDEIQKAIEQASQAPEGVESPAATQPEEQKPVPVEEFTYTCELSSMRHPENPDTRIVKGQAFTTRIKLTKFQAQGWVKAVGV
jgi:hypothetical protein